MKRIMCLLAVVALGMNCLYAAPDVESDNAEECLEAEVQVPALDADEEVLTVKQLRGKLLYRKGQARKLERAALAKDPALQEKIDDLTKQIRAAFESANPKLVEIYKLQDELQEKIDKAKK